MYNMKKTPSTLDDYIAAQGRRGDSLVAHLSPAEAELLKKMGGSGGINPKTGMLEFWGGDGGDGDGGMGGGYGDADANGGDPGGFGGPASDGMGDGVSNGGDSFGYAGPGWGSTPDSGGSSLSPEQQANLNAILGDMESTAKTNITIGRGFTPENRMGYLGALATNMGKGLASNKGRTIGTILGMMSPVPFGAIAGGKIGSYADAYDFSAPTAEDLAALGLPNPNASSAPENAGMYATDLNSPTAENIAALSEEERRRIIENPYTFNQQMVGLSNRDVPYLRRF